MLPSIEVLILWQIDDFGRRMQPITVFPRMPEHVAGVINLRGTIIPVVDLRKALSKQEVRDEDRTGIIIVRIDDEHVIGLIVDTVTDVLDISPDSLQHPSLVFQRDISFLLAFAKVQERLMMLMDIHELLQDLVLIEDLERLTEGCDGMGTKDNGEH